MFITHEYGVCPDGLTEVVGHVRGKKVGRGHGREIFENPQHPPITKSAVWSSLCRSWAKCAQGLTPKPMRLIGTEDKKSCPSKGTEGNAADGSQNRPRAFRPGRLLRRKVANVQCGRRPVVHHQQGKTLSLVGESPCGKSTAGRSILRAGRTPVRGRSTLTGKDIKWHWIRVALHKARLEHAE